MRLVVDELEVVECERVDIGLVGVDLQGLSGAQPPLSQQGWYFNHAQPTRGGRRGVQRAMAVAYREVQGRVLELLLERLHVVAVHVGVAEGVHELAALQAAHLRDHAGEQRVACDVERHAQAKVARALVHLAGQLTVRHVKLRRRPSGVSYSKNAKAAGGGGGGGFAESERQYLTTPRVHAGKTKQKTNHVTSQMIPESRDCREKTPITLLSVERS